MHLEPIVPSTVEMFEHFRNHSRYILPNYEYIWECKLPGHQPSIRVRIVEIASCPLHHVEGRCSLTQAVVDAIFAQQSELLMNTLPEQPAVLDHITSKSIFYNKERYQYTISGAPTKGIRDRIKQILEENMQKSLDDRDAIVKRKIIVYSAIMGIVTIILLFLYMINEERQRRMR